MPLSLQGLPTFNSDPGGWNLSLLQGTSFPLLVTKAKR